MRKEQLETLSRIAHGIAAQFGSGCEVVVHDLASADAEHSVVHIENGHISGRKVGDAASPVVLEQLKSQTAPEDKLGYLTRTPDGRILKSSTIYINGDDKKPIAILSINFDISALSMVESALHDITTPNREPTDEPKRITQNVNDLLDELIRQSVELIGKPPAMMTKDEKVQAMRFLSDHGAFLITKSGDKISKYFGISKYTLYSYIDAKHSGKS